MHSKLNSMQRVNPCPVEPGWLYPAYANSVDPDQLASEEAHWSGTTLFVIQYVNLYKQPDQVIWLAEN